MNRICEMLSIQYPIFQGAMAWVSNHAIASAVSEAGGLGIIAAGNAPTDWVRQEIRACKAKTDKPFAVNIMLHSPYAEEVAHLVVEEGIRIVTTGAGDPGKYMAMWKEHDIKVIPVVASVALARRMEKGGADAIVAEGCEAGGHVGEITTMSLVPQIADAVNIPVIAAGGIGDHRGFGAAIMLGAEAVQVGTRFVVAEECDIHQNFKDRVIKASDIDTVVTGRSTGHPVRVLRNQFTREFAKMEKEGVDHEALVNLGAGGLRAAVVDGDIARGSVMSGQIAGLMKEIKPVSVIIEEMFTEMNKKLVGID